MLRSFAKTHGTTTHATDAPEFLTHEPLQYLHVRRQEDRSRTVRIAGG